MNNLQFVCCKCAWKVVNELGLSWNPTGIYGGKALPYNKNPVLSHMIPTIRKVSYVINSKGI